MTTQPRTRPPQGEVTLFATLWAWFAFFVDAFRYAGFPWLPTVPKPHWHPDQLGDQRGKVILVTGGNSGTGYETAKAYYAHGARVYLACRSPVRAADAIANIQKGGALDIDGRWAYTPLGAGVGELVFLQLDLADLPSVEAAAAQFLAHESRLDVLFANAGVMASPPGEYTAQGYALQFGTNVLGHQRLISLLLPTLRKTSLSSPASPARLISLSSIGHAMAPLGGTDYTALQRGGRVLDRYREYGQSKWGNIALAKYVDAHYGPRAARPGGVPGSATAEGEVLAIAIHPGIIATNLYRHVGLDTVRKYAPAVVHAMYATPATGALNQLWAAGVDVATARTLSGTYIAPYQVQCRYRPDLDDPARIDKLWEYCAAQAARNE